ncbi:hypothetical protein C8R47DRAFT_1043003 [Mycena vitilis]|nr:hypothetical protein C8R47DRAFT_1043003 [Mycena vitilis]
MARGAKRLPVGPSTLSRLVAHLRAPPKLSLPSITSLRLTLASRNDHFGARHFLKEQLPRIRFANPDLDIQVRKMIKRPQDDWRPELQLSFHDGKTETLNLHAKWSTAIVRELMDSVESPSWERWKTEAARTGLPLIPGTEHEPTSARTEQTREPRFSLDEWLLKHPRKVRRRRDASPARDQMKTAGKDGAVAREKPKKDRDGAAHAKRKDTGSKVAAPIPERTAAQISGDTAKVKQDTEARKAAKKEARRARLDAPRLAEEAAERRVALELLSKPRTGAAAVLP